MTYIQYFTVNSVTTFDEPGSAYERILVHFALDVFVVSIGV